MGGEFDKLKYASWVKRKEKEIGYSYKAGFIHNDMPVTNPAVLHISDDTLSKLKKVQVENVKYRTDK